METLAVEQNEKNDKNNDDNDAERIHFLRIINAFRHYKVYSLKRVLLASKYFNELPVRHRELLPMFRNNLSDIRVCMEHNYEIIKLIVACTDDMFENKQHDTELQTEFGESPGKISTVATEFDMDKVKSTLKQLARDWSEDGEVERRTCNQPVIDEILRLFPRDDGDSSRSDVSILVPGAGLGRLAFEIARLGYSCQGNEFSLFMLFASNFVLNKCKNANAFTIYPWVHQFCNNMSVTSQTRPVRFPDINPSDLPDRTNFSMAAGDFLEIYTEPNKWDCVATVFFIDTAHNVVSYIETIYNILKPGGYWINLGPLLYHFSDMHNEPSIELSYEDLKHVITKLNFEIIKEERVSQAAYTQDALSMLKYQYDCVSFVARKLPLTPDAN